MIIIIIVWFIFICTGTKELLIHGAFAFIICTLFVLALVVFDSLKDYLGKELDFDRQKLNKKDEKKLKEESDIEQKIDELQKILQTLKSEISQNTKKDKSEPKN